MKRALGYAWAAPATAIGLACALLALVCGARVRAHRGAIECTGGELGQIVNALPRPVAFVAITLGHVILAVSPEVLERMREHEHVHVRQYERWGVLLPPAYALASLWQLARGRAPYAHNPFEREARERSGA
ncbi:MAG: hypothetical protein HZA61_11240 [Candidatus Eisenbacteria bacterium]|uniref:Signal peptide prediction n=1 Tax=Eiseniibacteriota bacterium TaxID=2212470 RepID=A0A933WB77_UNCEI|nr:hypothetical protein [Candidatus Eisenbacteria bacterium]